MSGIISDDNVCFNYIFKNIDKDTPISEKVRTLRNKIHLLSNFNKCRIPEVEKYEQMSKLINEYATIMDEFDKNKGMNNFAEGALSLCSIYRNESQSWKSHVDVNDVLKLPNVISLFDEIETRSAVLMQRDDNIILPSSKNIKNCWSKEDFFKALKSEDINKSAETQPINHEKLNSTECDSNVPGDEFLNPNRLLPNDFSTIVTTRDEIVKPDKKISFKRKWNCDDSSQRDVLSQDTQGKNASRCVERDKSAIVQEVANEASYSSFKTAKDLCILNRSSAHNQSSSSSGQSKRFLGTRRGPSSRFVSPLMNNDSNSSSKLASHSDTEDPVDERLKGIDTKMIELIMHEAMDRDLNIGWSDIAGLEFAKKTIKEIIVWPMLRPDIFNGLRGPPKGLLLFGPPGTGKTLIGKCISSQSKSTFFCVSSSSLTSKWVGEGEKMVRALFAVARCHQPAVIFIDEIDSLLTQRGDGEHESTRRIKTEFLVQLDGATTVSDERLLVIGATNRPQDIDEAARRRFVKRLYIPLPDESARGQLIVNLLKHQTHNLTDAQVLNISQMTDGYSGADLSSLCREAALGPIRSIVDIEGVSVDEVRPIELADFQQALQCVRSSVSDKELDQYVVWNKQFGSSRIN